MSGFIYIWFDKKKRRFYIGSHWGREDDGYICSSTWMRNAYKRRPQDFKRRIVATVDSSRNDLLIEEHRWLQMINKDELGNRYYNLTNHLNGHWFASDEERRMSISQKISNAPGRREKISAAHKGKTLSAEHREKLRQAKLGKKQSPELVAKRTEAIRNATKFYSEESRKKIGDAHRGKKLSVEHRLKLSMNHKSRKPHRGP